MTFYVYFSAQDGETFWILYQLKVLIFAFDFDVSCPATSLNDDLASHKSRLDTKSINSGHLSTT